MSSKALSIISVFIAVFSLVQIVPLSSTSAEEVVSDLEAPSLIEDAAEKLRRAVRRAYREHMQQKRRWEQRRRRLPERYRRRLEELRQFGDSLRHAERTCMAKISCTGGATGWTGVVEEILVDCPEGELCADPDSNGPVFLPHVGAGQVCHREWRKRSKDYGFAPFIHNAIGICMPAV